MKNEKWKIIGAARAEINPHPGLDSPHPGLDPGSAAEKYG